MSKKRRIAVKDMQVSLARLNSELDNLNEKISQVKLSDFETVKILISTRESVLRKIYVAERKIYLTGATGKPNGVDLEAKLPEN